MNLNTNKNIAQNNLGIIIADDIVLWFSFSHVQESVDAILKNKISYDLVVSRRDEFVTEFGVAKYVALLKMILWPSKTRISFEDFKEFPDLRNNFRGYFSVMGNFLYEYSYRSCGFYHRFVDNNRELAKKLIAIYDRQDYVFYTENSEEILLLYEAYELMLKDEEVTINHDLFR